VVVAEAVPLNANSKATTTAQTAIPIFPATAGRTNPVLLNC
jgi:hypothetical protein